MTITFERDTDREKVAHLKLKFGELNLLTPNAIANIYETVMDIPPNIAVLTISDGAADSIGVGGLTGGLHLKEVRNFSTTDARELLNLLYDSIQAIRDLDAVTVCGCGEYALGAGFELAMACDFRIATEDAKLGLPEINIGLVTGIHGGLLIRLVGLQLAKELILTGKPMSGSRAEQVRLVNRAVPATEHDDAVAEFVDRLADKSPLILRWQKEVFHAWRSNGIESGIDHSRETIVACFDTHDQQEAMEAFFEERDPTFTGQ